MVNLASIDGLINKAFQLACFILNDRDAALRVVTGALAKLEVATAAQGKRLYYRPTGRLWSRHSRSNRFRNNISLNEAHLLQRLIYIECEPFEVAHEQAKGSAGAAEEDLVIHFIKHLTKKTIKRNSFYVTLGLSRLLYSYTTAETMEIYNAVIQDPERVKDDYYYRSRKGVLMRELKQRFGDLIRICHGSRGEEKFQADDNQGRFVALVRESLSFFTPWHTPCLVPSGIDPIIDGIPSFSYRGDTEEDKIEVNRIHAVLHPDCFRRLTSDLRFDPPDTHLEIPRFFYANDMNGNGSSSDRRNPPKLSEQDLISIRDALDGNAARRKTSHTDLVRIMVDGSERARIDLTTTRSARFGLDRDAELIEIRSRDNAGEELLLASHFLAPTESDSEFQSVDTSITLEGGQKISIRVSPAARENGAFIDVSYRETNPIRAASRWLHHLTKPESSNQARSIWKDRRVFVSALAFLLLAISFGVIIKYGRQGNGRAVEQKQASTVKREQTREPENRSTNGDDKGTSTAAGTNTAKSLNPAPPQGLTARQQRKRVGTSSRYEGTTGKSAEPNSDIPNESRTATESRGISARPGDASLSTIRKVYIETVGDEGLSQSVREMFSERWSPGSQIILVNNRDSADALLKLTVERSAGAEPETANVGVELINAGGKVIWTSPMGHYQGSPSEVSTSIVRDLLAAIQRSKQRP